MNIKINKDFETEYKDELYRGFTTREAAGIAAGAAMAAAVAFLLYRFAGIPLTAGIYGGVSCAVPFLASGFMSIQGLSPARYLKEMVYAYRTRLLVYAADELPEKRRGFSMEKPKAGKKRPWLRTGSWHGGKGARR